MYRRPIRREERKRNKGYETRSKRGEQRGGNKTMKNLRNRINSIPSGIKQLANIENYNPSKLLPETSKIFA